MWWWLLLLPILPTLAVLLLGRRHVAIRRKNCCGKGCGCLFPAKND